MRKSASACLTLLLCIFLPGYLSAQSITMADDGTINEGTEASEVITVTLSGSGLTFADPITPANIQVDNLPGGVTCTITRTDDTHLAITLNASRTKDYDSNITNLTVTIPDTEINGYSGPALSANSGVTFIAVNDVESLSMSGSFTEGSENGGIITVTVTGGTFADPPTQGSWQLANLPIGVTQGTVSLSTPNTASIPLVGNRTVDYDTDITNTLVIILGSQVDDTTGSDFVVSTGVTFTAVDDTESLSMSDDGSITEGAENGEVITVTITGGTFAESIIPGNWNLTNLPNLVTKGSVTKTSPTTVQITLSGNRGNDYDTDITNLTLTISQAEVFDTSGADFVLNTGVTFTAVNDVESIAMTDDGYIEEGSENGEIITVTLTGGTFVSSLTPSSWTLTNLPVGVSKGTVTRTSATSATIALSGNRTVDYSTDITNLTLTIASSEIYDTTGGPGLTVNTGVTFTALDEPVAVLTSESVDICAGGVYNLTVTISGGTSPYDLKYKKPDNSIITLLNKTSPVLIPAQDDGTYVLTEVKDDNSVPGSFSGSATVTVNPLPNPSITGNTTACNGSIEVYHAVGTTGSTYLWEIEDDGTAVGLLTNDSLVVQWTWDNSKDNGHINVTETTDKGCVKKSSSVTISLPDSPGKPTINTTPTANVHEFCEGATLILRCQESSTGYLWSNDISTRNNTVSASGDYTVRRIGSNGCYSPSSDPWAVTRNPKPMASIAVQGNNAICINQTGTFRINLYQGTVPYTVQYTDGTTPATNNTSAAYLDVTDSKATPGTITYTITSITDSKSCTGQILTPSASITVNDLPAVTFNPPTTTYLSSAGPQDFSGYVTPTGGVFIGNAVAANKFYPSLADTLQLNDVTYVYTNPATGCQNSVTVQFEVLAEKGDILAPHAYEDAAGNYIYCMDAAQDTLIGSSILGNPGGSFIFGGSGLYNIGNDRAIFRPWEAGAGTHEIAYNYTITVYQYIYVWNPITLLYDKDSIPVQEPAPPVKKTFVIDDPGSRIITGLLDAYCANSDSAEIKLLGSIINKDVPGFEGIETVTGTGVSNPFPGRYWLNPRKGATGQRTITYTYTRNFSQCVIRDQKVVTVNPLPQLAFEILDSCIFTTAGTDSIPFKNNSPDSATVISWNWNFGDGLSGTEKNPWHDYNSVGTKLIVLRATNNLNCTDQVQKIKEFQQISRALLDDWENECFGDTMKFIANRDNGRIISYKWDFDDQSTYPDSVTYNPMHKYATPGSYMVELKVINNFGCKDTLIQSIPVRPTFLVTGEDPYFEDFTQGSGGWLAGVASGSANSWEFGMAAGTIINDTLAGNIWATSLGGLYQNNEKSFVESPCFDFAEIDKPMIRMKYWTHTENTRDGAVLQTSINDGKDWIVLGSNLDGINWYNSALLTGEPGGQRLGWTGTSQTTWKEGRNLMDHLKGKKLRVRIAFGADAVASNYEGFAFDEVWVGERTRMVLLEHFTNSTSTQCIQADPDVNAVANTNPKEVIDIQYHTSFPGNDPRNQYFPSGPSSRTLYYSVATVPYSVMDGKEYFQGFTGEGGAYSWEESDLLKRVLVDPLVDIDLNASYLQENSLYIDARMKLRNSNLAAQNLTLQLAITENESAVFEGVLKKMLPDAGGTSLIGKWTGDSSVIYKSWTFNPADFARLDSLVLIGFVQNEDTKVVYQTAYLPFKQLLGTGIFFRDPAFSGMDFLLFPNPVSDECYLKFTGELKEDMKMMVFNELGSLVEVRTVEKGIDLASFNVGRYPEGIYFVKVTNDRDTMGWKRFVVIH